MKTKLYILLLILPLLFLQQGCNKDYPKDIPKWLKEKIKEKEKQCKNRGCSCTDSGVGCWFISEWELGDEKYYLLDFGYNESYPVEFVIIYDSTGNEVCEGNYDRYIYIAGSEEAHRSVCSDFLEDAIKVRLIWENK